jgi:hypothetical protein
MARVTANANEPTDASLIGTMTNGKSKMATGNVHTPVVAKIILLFGFPLDTTMFRYIDQQE